MTPTQMEKRERRMAEAQAERAKKHLYTWCSERGKYVIEAPLVDGGLVIAVLEAAQGDTAAHYQAHAICRALDRVAQQANTGSNS